MSAAPPPRRRPSKAVYRRRRLITFLILVALIVFVVVLIARCSSGPEPLPTPTSTKTTTPSLIPLVSPTSTSTPNAQGQYVGDAKECAPSALEVGAYTDKTNYNAGEQPQLIMSVTNKGTTDCKVNVGTSQQVYQVTSGSDVWWQSTDCQTEKADFWILLTAGQTQRIGPLSWVRERSSPDTCNTTREAATADGASYYLTTTLGGVQATESTQFVLN